MTIPLRNIVFEKVKEGVNTTDQDLSKQLSKQGLTISDAMFNKILLDLEINGLVKVGWITKDTRRIEIVEESQEEDSVDKQNREQLERDYESSFPGNSETNTTSNRSSSSSYSRSSRSPKRRTRESKEVVTSSKSSEKEDYGGSEDTGDIDQISN